METNYMNPEEQDDQFADENQNESSDLPGEETPGDDPANQEDFPETEDDELTGDGTEDGEQSLTDDEDEPADTDAANPSETNS